MFPLLIRLSYTLLAVSDTAAILVSWVSSTATIPLLWWIGRTWFSPRAGTTAAWLFAVDGMQIAFARVALTDATFTLLFLASLHLLRRAVHSNCSIAAIPAGLCTGLAWLTKYNGFLPLVLAVAFLDLSSWRRSFRHWLAACIIACLMYSTWLVLFHVKHPDGYSALLKHQRGYTLGPAAIPANWVRGFVMWSLASNSATAFVVAGGLLVRAAAPQTSINRVMFVCAALLAFTSAFCSCPQVALLIPALLAIVSFRTGWILLWMAALPAIYTPYFRIWLPTESMLLLFASHAIAGVATLSRAKTMAFSLAILGSLVVGGWTTFRTPLPETPAGYRDAVARLAEWVSSRPDRVFALVRRPVYFYWAMVGKTPLAALGGAANDVSRIGTEDLLVVDAALKDSPAFFAEFRELTKNGELSTAAAFPADPSIVTRLDDFDSRLTDSPYTLQVFQRRKE